MKYLKRGIGFFLEKIKNRSISLKKLSPNLFDKIVRQRSFMYYLTTSFQCTVMTRRFKLYGDIDQNIWIGISDQSDICFINRLNIHKSH